MLPFITFYSLYTSTELYSPELFDSFTHYVTHLLSYNLRRNSSYAYGLFVFIYLIFLFLFVSLCFVWHLARNKCYLNIASLLYIYYDVYWWHVPFHPAYPINCSIQYVNCVNFTETACDLLGYVRSFILLSNKSKIHLHS